MEHQNNTQTIYSQQVVEFTTVVAESCRFLENLGETTKIVFVEKSLKLFSLLYLKTVLLENPQNEEIDNAVERFVGESDYEDVRQHIARILGEDDSFLDTFHPDMPLSDMPIAITVSESLADVYQEIRDYAANYQLGYEEVMSNSLAICLENFAAHWGQKLLNALRALHALKYGENEN